MRSSDGAPTRWPTRTTLAWRADRLEIEFDCEDEDAWGELVARDSPLWTEEAVEVFLAPGEETPRRYFEIELSPRGAVFDARVESPNGDRTDWRVDPSWRCAGLATEVRPTGVRADWRARMSIPWSSLSTGPLPRCWRLNLFRIERPRSGVPPELSAWSPTLVEPDDFHRPARFGRLLLDDAASDSPRESTSGSRESAPLDADSSYTRRSVSGTTNENRWLFLPTTSLPPLATSPRRTAISPA